MPEGLLPKLHPPERKTLTLKSRRPEFQTPKPQILNGLTAGPTLANPELSPNIRQPVRTDTDPTIEGLCI